MLITPATRLFLQRLFRRRLVLLAAILLLVIVILAVFAPLIAPYSPTGMRISQRLKPPSLTNWFGTDEFGRDILSRIIYGGRASLGIGMAVVIASMVAGTTLGLLAGYFRALDGPIMRLVDAMMSRCLALQPGMSCWRLPLSTRRA
jgi:peptide/nickel transport system permease protein